MTDVDVSPPQDFWEIARNVRAGFVEQVTPAKLFEFSVMVKQMGSMDVDAFKNIYNNVMNSQPEHVDYDLSLSNIGRLDFPEIYGRFQFLSLYGPTFSATQDERVSGVCTVNGRLSFTFIHKENYMDKVVAETIISHTLQTLQNAIG